SVRATDEVTQDDSLLDTARIRVAYVIAGARPAELGNYNAFTGVGLAQFVVDQNRLIDRLLVGEALPVGQDVCGDIVNCRYQLGVFDPHMPDFAGRYRSVGRPLHALNQLDQIANLLFPTEDGFVADDNAVDVAMTPRKVDDRMNFALIAI